VAFSSTERTALAARVRYELGYSSVTVSGEPWIDWSYAPEVALDNLYTGAETTSATSVTTTSEPTTITLASGTGFASGLRVHVGAGITREVVVAQNVSGASLAATFAKLHSGTYPVEVESGESMLRTILTKIDDVTDRIQKGFPRGGLKAIVGEVEWYEGGVFEELNAELGRWRDSLAALLKLPNLRNNRGGSTLSVY
jgi:hypothetical protein